MDRYTDENGNETILSREDLAILRWQEQSGTWPTQEPARQDGCMVLIVGLGAGLLGGAALVVEGLVRWLA
jgi:hypothetical protein